MHIRRRYSDGPIGALIDKIKSILSRWKSEFESISFGRKILYIFSKVLKIQTALNVTSSAVAMGKIVKELYVLKREVQNAGYDPNTHPVYQQEKMSVKIGIPLGAVVVLITNLIQYLIAAGLEKVALAKRKQDSAYWIRHVDGVVDNIIEKLKAAYQKFKQKFSDLSVGRKILFIMAKVIKLGGVIGAGVYGGNAGKLLLELRSLKKAANLAIIEGEEEVKNDPSGASRFFLYMSLGGVVGSAITYLLGVLTEKIATSKDY